ncbi:uncharacterized protein CLUP02_15331 [Colletotrichum lupini]|uniref:Uncharacterized protein n=1 Tax=Colletotrichum lupini TaxID=145971 RepID=A0A9Q8T6N2_9PEZI|nr:uncharacterized protein CLUP02_15331 [Colletotrichum lupini]UQC89800.1 hypothetical protein CLUP02_15331 [Colletotrichum lupini]
MSEYEALAPWQGLQGIPFRLGAAGSAISVRPAVCEQLEHWRILLPHAHAAMMVMILCPLSCPVRLVIGEFPDVPDPMLDPNTEFETFYFLPGTLSPSHSSFSLFCFTREYSHVM